MSRPETQSRLGKCVQLQNKILIEKQSTQKAYIFSLGVKPALKICIQQGQVIVYRNFTLEKGLFCLKKILRLVLSVSRPETWHPYKKKLVILQQLYVSWKLLTFFETIPLFWNVCDGTMKPFCQSVFTFQTSQKYRINYPCAWTSFHLNIP